MKRLLHLASLICAMVMVPQVACAALPSIAGGVYGSDKPSQTSGALVVSSGASVPVVPLSLQASVLVPVTSSNVYALTGEIRGLSGGGFGGAYIGGGLGIGNLSADGSGGGVFTVFVGKPIAPFTTFEARFYRGMQSGGASAGFVGLRFTL